MTREEFIKRFVEILKSKVNLSEGNVAEISLLLELMPNTYQPTVYYYPYNQSYWKNNPYEDNKIYYASSDVSDINNDTANRKFVKKLNEITGGDELKGDALINALMENIFS